MTDFTFLMWNLKKKVGEKLDALKELYDERKPDFLLLIETEIDDSEIIRLSQNNLRSVMLNDKKTIRLYVSTNINIQVINEEEMEMEASEGKRKQIKERLIFFKLNINNENILLVGIHFPSKFNHTTSVQQQIMKRWKGWIEGQERLLKTDKTILFGDFNLNPQEIALYSHEGLSAHSTINNSSKVKTQYYNPMWATLGDFIYKTDTPKVPDTYFHDIGEDNIDEIHWNVLNGLLMKSSMVPYFLKRDLEIITNTKGHSFFSNNQIELNYSDHLPVQFKFKI
jgi:exonuclease III